MSNRAGKLTGERRSLVAVAVYLARQHDVPFKRLETIYDRDRSQLWRLAQEGEALMQQKTGLMQHQAACCQGPDAERLGAISCTLAEADSMSGIFDSPPTPKPIQVPAAPTASDPAVTNAARQEQINAARARGRGATIITGGQGTGGPPPTQSKVLFGG